MQTTFLGRPVIAFLLLPLGENFLASAKAAPSVDIVRQCHPKRLEQV